MPTATHTKPTVTVGPGGLVRVTWLAADGQRTVVVRVAIEPGTPPHVSELHVRDPSPVGLRELRLGAIERLVTHPDRRAEILKHIDEESPDVFDAFPGEESLRTGPAVLGRVERPLRLDGAFFRQFAAAYWEAVEAMRPVLPMLSERYGAPPDTVNRWLKQARREGFIEAPRDSLH